MRGTCVKPNTPTQSAILHRVKNMVRKLLLSAVSRSRSSRSCSLRWPSDVRAEAQGNTHPEVPLIVPNDGGDVVGDVNGAAAGRRKRVVSSARWHRRDSRWRESEMQHNTQAQNRGNHAEGVQKTRSLRHVIRVLHFQLRLGFVVPLVESKLKCDLLQGDDGGYGGDGA